MNIVTTRQRPGWRVASAAAPIGRIASAGMIVGPCPCACNSGGFCGGCGHAGCGGRR